jgi:uncharacterized protein YuzE
MHGLHARRRHACVALPLTTPLPQCLCRPSLTTPLIHFSHCTCVPHAAAKKTKKQEADLFMDINSDDEVAEIESEGESKLCCATSASAARALRLLLLVAHWRVEWVVTLARWNSLMEPPVRRALQGCGH